MIVTQHARYTALFRLLHQRRMVGIQRQIPLSRLEQEWVDTCGLRVGDLHLAIEELRVAGGLVRQASGGVITLQLTDRGVLRLNAWRELLQVPPWSSARVGLAERINTIRVLGVARDRVTRRLRSEQAGSGTSLIMDRRTMG